MRCEAKNRRIILMIMKKLIPICFVFLSGALSSLPSQDFSYLRYLNHAPGTLSASVTEINTSTGKVVINGVDTSSPSIPFSFIWGDGSSSSGWFPQQHLYSDKGKNYMIQVSSKKDTVNTVAFFTEPKITRQNISEKISVDIASRAELLEARWYSPISVNPFTPQSFEVIKEGTIEYVLTALADIMLGYCSEYLWYCADSTFHQLIFNAADYGGGYSLWYTDPPSFGVNRNAFKGSVLWVVLAHESAHSFTLNYPGSYHIGGRTDGNANAIYSETMARIISMCAGYDLINRHGEYGIPEDMINPVRLDFTAGFKNLHNLYQGYIDSGRHFTSWNNPATGADETSPVFSALAFEFLVRAENSGLTVAYHAKRLMEFFSHFDSGWEQQYDPLNPSEEGNLFRSTLMVAAFSFALKGDLRQDFRDLGFPLSDNTYDQLMQDASTGISEIPAMARSIVYPNPFRSGITLTGLPNFGKNANILIFDALGRQLLAREMEINQDKVIIDLPSLPEGFYNLVIQSETKTWHRKIVKIQ